MQGGAARKLTERAQAAGKAAEAIRAVREVLQAFRDLSAVDPQTVFGHTVREHRQAIESFDRDLQALCFDGREIEEVASEIGFGQEAVTLIRAAHLRLRVLRTLAATLSGDAHAIEGEAPEVRAEVEKVLGERANANVRHWTREERETLGQRERPFSQEFDAHLIGS